MRSDVSEETWFAALQEARCHWALGDDNGFLRQAAALREERPDRAEPLYDLARFHRERGMHETAMHFAEAGVALPRPGEREKFVEDPVYEWGLKEEISLSGFYCRDPVRRECGAAACNWLASNPDIPADTRDQARRNSVLLPEAHGRSHFTVCKGNGGRRRAGLMEHELGRSRELRSRLDTHPRVLVAILAKQKEKALPLFLRCIEELDYPKSSIVLYVRTNNNTDRTEQILRDWIARVGSSYAARRIGCRAGRGAGGDVCSARMECDEVPCIGKHTQRESRENRRTCLRFLFRMRRG